MKKLLLLGLLAVASVVTYAAVPVTAAPVVAAPAAAVVAPCSVPNLVLPVSNTPPIGPYCQTGGTVDKACLEACKAAFQQTLYDLAINATTAANNIRIMHNIAANTCWINYQTCLNGGSVITCGNIYAGCTNAACLTASNNMAAIQTTLDARVSQAFVDFYACANNCCTDN